MKQTAYFDSDALQLRSQVQACVARDDGYFDVYLRHTLFHPQGGGQAADRGVIDDQLVLAVRHTEHGIAHTVAHALPLVEVNIQVDANLRQLHARLHSAGHLLASVAEMHGWRPLKGHHWPGEARVVLQAQAEACDLQAEVLTAEVNSCLQAGLSRHITYQDGQRLIAFGDFPAHPCGGTHVINSAAVGPILITKIKHKAGQLSLSYTLAETGER